MNLTETVYFIQVEPTNPNWGSIFFLKNERNYFTDNYMSEDAQFYSMESVKRKLRNLKASQKAGWFKNIKILKKTIEEVEL